MRRFFDMKKAQGKRFSACAKVSTDVAKHISPQKREGQLLQSEDPS